MTSDYRPSRAHQALASLAQADREEERGGDPAGIAYLRACARQLLAQEVIVETLPFPRANLQAERELSEALNHHAALRQRARKAG